MDVVFLFMSQGNAPAGSTPDNWQPNSPCADFYHEDFAHEGYFKLMGDLLSMKWIDKLSIFFESNRGPGFANWVDHPRAYCAVVPEIRFVEPYIKENTVVFVRGGFKHWHDWLLKYKGKNWLILYAANTGRGRWNWWDVILDDLGMTSFLDSFGRLYLPFIKPIDDVFFSPTVEKAKWDVMIGSSHIHDKKGQWRGLKVLQAYEKKYQKRLSAVMPGSTRRGTKTIEMLEVIKREGWEIYMPGHVSREKLKSIYNRSRMGLYLGAHGQNDRGPLEALSCGTPILLGSPEYHTTWLRKIPSVFTLVDKDNYQTIASVLSFLDSKDQGSNKTQTSMSFHRTLGYQNSLDLMSRIFSFCGSSPPTIQAKLQLRQQIRSMT